MLRSLALLLAVACSTPDGAGPGHDDDPGGDPDGNGGETDTPTVEESDLPPLDSAVDTFRYADSEAPADSGADPVDTDVTAATPRGVHDQLYTPGQLLSFPPLVVTATRLVTRPPATNGFSAQLPTGTAVGSGIYVDLKDGQTLPAVGDLVQVVGSYDQWPQHAAIPTETMARITVHPSVVGTSWTKVGTSALPAPVALAPADVEGLGEDYEGMLVRVSTTGRMSITKNPSSYLEFPLAATGGTAFTVDPWFFDYTQVLDVRLRGSVSALVGVMWYEPTAHKVLPQSTVDFVGWTPP